MPWTKVYQEEKKIKDKELKKQFDNKEITYDEKVGEQIVFKREMDKRGYCTYKLVVVEPDWSIYEAGK